MARRLSEDQRALDMPAGHGNAGLASNFIDLADAKLRSGGAEARRALVRAVLVDLLGLLNDAMEPLDLLRRQWCAEPAPHGGKSTRPDR